MHRIAALIVIVLGIGLSAQAQTVVQIESELLAHLNKLDEASNYGGSGDYEVLAAENKALRTALIKYGNRSDVLSYGFKRLKGRMYITTSTDGRLRAYSWDSNEGGTMHDFLTLFQFRGSDGKVRTSSDDYEQSMEDRGAGTFVHDIFQTQTASGPVYLVVNTFIGSTSLRGQGIHAFRIRGDMLDRKAKMIKTASGVTDNIAFAYDFFSVVDRPDSPITLFTYDRVKRSFRFPIVIEDQKTPQGRVTDRYITYRFNGKYFVKVP